MVQNSTNINETNNYFSFQTVEHKKDHNIWHWETTTSHLKRFISTQKTTTYDVGNPGHCLRHGTTSTNRDIYTFHLICPLFDVKFNLHP